MNIWNFLGLPSDHRPEDKTVQLVKHFADVEKKITYPVIGQRKFDGVFALLVCDGNGVGIFGRTGRLFTGLSRMLPKIMPKGRVVFIAELCCDSCSLEVLSGLVNPNRKREDTPEEVELRKHFYFAYHDMLYLSELIEGESKRPYSLRLLDLERHTLDLADLPGYIPTSTELKDAEECHAFSDMRIAMDCEGAVFKMPNEGWIAGRKNHVQTKEVCGVDFDLLVTGMVEGKGKHRGMVGKLLVRWLPYGIPFTGVPSGAPSSCFTEDLPVDGCFTQKMRQAWWDGEQICGKIVHVHALQIGSKGALRLPKVKAVRIDKTVADL